jgi:protein-serine/threonine kinase
MAYAARRPLPPPPMDINGVYEYAGLPRSPVSSADMYSASSPYSATPFPFFPFSSRPVADEAYSPTRSILAGGTLLHKGFYDLLALATPSRLFAAASPSKLAAGPRYEQIYPGSPPAIVPSALDAKGVVKSPAPGAVTPLVKNRRISKDMVSSPTGFV